MEVVDLPGLYGFGSDSVAEKIARDYLINEKPDVVVDIVDSSNLMRNLYLTLLLLEMGVNVIVVLNMFDEATKSMKIDVGMLSELLGVPVVPTVARRGEGIDELKDAILKEAGKSRRSFVGYGGDVETLITKIEQELDNLNLPKTIPPRWVALKLLEGDEEIKEIVGDVRLRDMPNIRGDVILAQRRYEAIRSILRLCVEKKGERWKISDRIDKFILHKYLGYPIFLIILWGAFVFSYRASAPISDLIDSFFSTLSEYSSSYLSGAVGSFVSGAVISGLGSVLVFIPPIFFVFFVIAVLEDTGYMARVAFLMDRAMGVVGLSGKSFIPLVLGFGCNVPAIMATRTIESERERILTILINPLMSCSARLPVYVLIAGVFFRDHAGTVIFSMYLLGILLAMVLSVVFGRSVLKGAPSPFIIELPPYRIPSIKTVLMATWMRGKHFLKKAGTVIFGVVILAWYLSSYPTGTIEGSYLAQIGQFLSPLMEPLGFDWRITSALLMGFLAKEAVVGTLGVLYGTELSTALSTSIDPVSAYAFMVFTLLYVPCVAAMAVVRQETASWKWTAFVILYELLLAYTVALFIVLIGRLIF
ncbi:ferrous iron transport protein B [Methanosarcinales archaeon]|nr:MAG: ferrous iron transport protein B [Methanosarcinales archaeon]